MSCFELFTNSSLILRPYSVSIFWRETPHMVRNPVIMYSLNLFSMDSLSDSEGNTEASMDLIYLELLEMFQLLILPSKE